MYLTAETKFNRKKTDLRIATTCKLGYLLVQKVCETKVPFPVTIFSNLKLIVEGLFRLQTTRKKETLDFGESPYFVPKVPFPFTIFNNLKFIFEGSFRLHKVPFPFTIFNNLKFIVEGLFRLHITRKRNAGFW